MTVNLANPRLTIQFEDSIPEARVSLESILCTEELQRRPSRPPDHEKENRALVALVSALADSPSTILQTLAETILDITQCDSAGLSLLTRDGKRPDTYGKRFYWPAIAGMWNPHVGSGTPRDFGPCGDVLDQNRTLLFRHFERRYPYFEPSFRQPTNACWSRFTSPARRSAPSGRSCTATAANSTQKMTGSWPLLGSLPLQRIKH